MDRKINCRRLLELKTRQKKFAPCRRLTEEEILENVDYCMAYAETLCAKECATLQAKVATRLSIHQAELTRGGILVVHNNVVDVQSSISQFRLDTNKFQKEVLEMLHELKGDNADHEQVVVAERNADHELPHVRVPKRVYPAWKHRAVTAEQQLHETVATEQTLHETVAKTVVALAAAERKLREYELRAVESEQKLREYQLRAV